MSDLVTIVSSMGGRVPGLLASMPNFSVSAAAATVISALNDPFAGMGLGTTAYSTVGTVPSAVALSGTNLVVGASVPPRAAHYPITVQAVSGDGKQTVSETIRCRATLP